MHKLKQIETPVFSPPPQVQLSPERQNFMEAWRKAKSAIDLIALQKTDPKEDNNAFAGFMYKFPETLKALQEAFNVLVKSCYPPPAVQQVVVYEKPMSSGESVPNPVLNELRAQLEPQSSPIEVGTTEWYRQAGFTDDEIQALKAAGDAFRAMEDRTMDMLTEAIRSVGERSIDKSSAPIEEDEPAPDVDHNTG